MISHLIAFIFYTAAMIGVLFSAFLIYKKMNVNSSNVNRGLIKVLDSCMISPKKTLLIVKVNNEKFLIASGIEHTTFLAKLENANEISKIKEPAKVQNNIQNKVQNNISNEIIKELTNNSAKNTAMDVLRKKEAEIQKLKESYAESFKNLLEQSENEIETQINEIKNPQNEYKDLYSTKENIINRQYAKLSNKKELLELLKNSKYNEIGSKF